MADKQEFQDLLGRMLGSIIKALFIGLLKVLGLAIYFMARSIELIAGAVAEKLKQHVDNY